MGYVSGDNACIEHLKGVLPPHSKLLAQSKGNSHETGRPRRNLMDVFNPTENRCKRTTMKTP